MNGDLNNNPCPPPPNYPPDGQVTLTITQPVKKPTEIRIPECKVQPVRPPQRPWLQCIENQRISDRVRRPMARICHYREMPPVVIPISKYKCLQDKMTEIERTKAERQARCMERECQRIDSRNRHSCWNFTVESLIQRKRNGEMIKEEVDIANDKALLDELKEREAQENQEILEKSKKMMLYRKGLIRDLHASMSLSKALKENLDEIKNSNRNEEQTKMSPPFLNKICLQKMLWRDNTPEYKKRDFKIPCSKERITLIQQNEKRDRERDEILKSHKASLENIRNEEPEPYSASYLKYIEDPKCPDDPKADKEKEKAARRINLFEDIQDRLTLDAFMEAREKEQERQAASFNHYAREKARIVKEKQRQLIDEKVKRNQEASEKAATVLLNMKASKFTRTGNYDELKERWEWEYKEKMENKKIEHGRIMGLIYDDFWKRKNQEVCKRQMLDASREWAKESLTACDNYKMECDEKSTRRLEAEELAQFHKSQACEKKAREDKARHLDCVWGWKTKTSYEAEEKEMRDYAQTCLEEWQFKGRSTLPMQIAMKKWDYEGGMYPHWKNEKITQTAENCDGSGEQAKPKKYETTGIRLGLGNPNGT